MLTFEKLLRARNFLFQFFMFSTPAAADDEPASHEQRRFARAQAAASHS
jgi:hypothetical protein